MRLISWNVNGIRAVQKKGFLDWIAKEAPDVLCLQEIKAKPEQLPDAARELAGFTSYWNPALRPGYSGVAMYVKTPPKRLEFGLGEGRFDDEGRVIKAEFDQFMADRRGRPPARLRNAAHGSFGRNPQGRWLKQRHSSLHS